MLPTTADELDVILLLSYTGGLGTFEASEVTQQGKAQSRPSKQYSEVQSRPTRQHSLSRRSPG